MDSFEELKALFIEYFGEKKIVSVEPETDETILVSLQNGFLYRFGKRNDEIFLKTILSPYPREGT